ncbi:endonuclease [Actinoplanes capillaceus]|uniref:Endonuclease n=1 Tax=Actinoplanes campanulatus TaxID=113559 RepID=A0ABQ3WCL3_9ACTN|nr:endonuclease/exonuclease/phosphatase family protein [Actinoplanes capillaceus]GID43123.1 endonuclease [Actinoplanes capillaceus]
MPDYYVAWWNLENLFDEENSPHRTEKVARAIHNDIAGWTPELRDQKIAQLASVIVRMNGGAGPDLLGVCEVENRFVLDLLAEAVHTELPGRKYGIVHADTGDARGIDVAFLYSLDRFAVPAAGDVFFHVVMRRNATREIVQVNFRTTTGQILVVFGNHWPSRSGGQFESAGYRHIAGETLAYFHSRALEVLGPGTPALAMGDFNDEPFDVSMVKHALSTRQRRRVIEADTPRLWNLMWPETGVPDGSFYFENEPNQLDQFLVNVNMAGDADPLRVDPASVEVLRFPGTVDTGIYPKPRPFGGMGHDVDVTGFSDHFPIGMRVTETV